MRKILGLVVLAGLIGIPAFGDSITVQAGYFFPRAESDVYVQNALETTFEKDDLNDFAGSVRYDWFLGEHVNLGANFAYYQSDTTVQDVEFEFENGQPILRNISLEIVPLEASVQFLPAGRNVPVIPYFGGGVGLYYWEYEELGDFVVDRFGNNPRIITGSAFSDGWDPGFHVEGGVHIPVSRGFAINAEGKYWWADGDLDIEGFDPAFDPIDLSGLMVSGGVSIWF